MIFKGSRYEKGTIYTDAENDVPYLAFERTVIDPDPNTDIEYQFKQGDRLDILSAIFYGDPAYKWILLYANTQYMAETDIKAGDILIIPELGRVIT